MAVAAARAVEFVGLPEARINLAQAVAYVALAPKSNARHHRHRRPPLAEVRRSRQPDAARPRSATPLSGGPAARPKAPATCTRTVTAGFEPTQRYLPDELGDRRFYEPSQNGFEARLAELLDDLRRRRAEASD